MSCFNKEIAIGVTTDYENVNLETRFQMWGVYLWLRTLGVFTRMLVPKQGDENKLHLPISYHPYYTKQSFQVGKRKIDACLSIGPKLCCKHLEEIEKQGTILKEDTKLVAYGLVETELMESVGSFRKKTICWSADYYDAIYTSYLADRDRFLKAGNDASILLNPYLIADTIHYSPESVPQNVTSKPYILVFVKTLSKEDCQAISSLQKKYQWELLLWEKFEGELSGISISDAELDYFYGILKDARYLVTDTAVIAGLAMQCKIPMTLRIGQDEELSSFVKHYGLKAAYGAICSSEEEFAKLVHAQSKGRIKLTYERIDACRILEDALGLTQFVDCPTQIRKSDCSGCYACHEICPRQAISMNRDEEGFVFPSVNRELCTDCGLCKKACIARENKQYASDRVFSSSVSFPISRVGTCKSKEQLEASTSGGVFQSLARYVIEEKKGVVVGACFDENARVVTGFAQTMEEALLFSGSKYVKREPSGVYRKVKEFLKEGRFVLFSGLPCECAGLLASLSKDYDNLILCELVCHGGPTPKLYEKYVGHIETALKAKVTRVDFRDKSVSWLPKDMKMRFDFSDRKPFRVNGKRNNYMNAFLKNYIFRVSCYRCQYLKEQRSGDITIGDCYAPLQTDSTLLNPKGVSMIITNTPKGEELFQKVEKEFDYKETTLTKAFGKNHILPSIMPEEREIILRKMDQMKINDLLERYNPYKQN